MGRKLTVKDFEQEYRVPAKTIYHWRATGYGPRGVRVGKRLLFDETEVERWFDQLAAAQAVAR